MKNTCKMTFLLPSMVCAYCTMLICISAIILFYMFLFFLPFNTVLVVFVL